MRWLAAFVMGGRTRAILVAAASAVTALLVPPITSPLSYLGGAVIALGTLRFGYREGLLLLAAAALGTAVLAQLAMGQAQAVVLATLVLWVPTWLLAWVLRSTGSLALVMQAAALLGIIGLLGVYAVFGDLAPWWQKALQPLMVPLLEQTGLSVETEQFLQRAANMMTGILVGATVLGLLMTMFLARAWQAMLYNPGGFRGEFHSLRLKPVTAWLTLGLVVVAQLSDGMVATLAMQSALILLVIYLVVGLALVHGTVGLLGAHVGWLIAVYILLLAAPPQTMMLLVLMGLTDSWLDFRSRLGNRPGGAS